MGEKTSRQKLPNIIGLCDSFDQSIIGPMFLRCFNVMLEELGSFQRQPVTGMARVFFFLLNFRIAFEDSQFDRRGVGASRASFEKKKLPRATS